MELFLPELDEVVRQWMATEIEADSVAGRLNVSPLLTSSGILQWGGVLLEAALWHDALWLAHRMLEDQLVIRTKRSRKLGNGSENVRVPDSAVFSLARNEFMQYYSRAICRKALAAGIDTVVIYRVMNPNVPRPQQDIPLGQGLSVREVFAALQQHHNLDAALGLPPGPVSGLSICTPLSASQFATFGNRA